MMVSVVSALVSRCGDCHEQRSVLGSLSNEEQPDQRMGENYCRQADPEDEQNVESR